MTVSTSGTASVPTLRERLRASALLALPFQVGSIVVAIALGMLGAEVELPLTLLLVFAYAAPLLVELVFRTTLPWTLQLSYLVFIAAGSFAGSALHVYWYFPLWDVIVHFYSGIMLAWLGMLLVRRAEERTGVGLPMWFSLTVILLTPMAFAAAWELCEFASDILIGTASQHGNTDSMTDLLAGTAGGVAAIVLLLLTRRPRTLAPASLLTRS
ncbi:hypothetical protein ABZ477_15880 [Microbacterium sp. NPDC019599]|uniref:hypothetical protein n=1 Tax=Microbacterium sp. NPDC019599 TaxID=3154690 RepID=UPI0033CCCEA7